MLPIRPAWQYRGIEDALRSTAGQTEIHYWCIADLFDGRLVRAYADGDAEHGSMTMAGLPPTSGRGDDDTPFFIVGSGRSGTTLLRSLLSAHSDLAVTPETHFMKRADRAGAARRDAPADFTAFWRDLTTWKRFVDLGVQPDDVLARIQHAGSFTFRTIFAAMLQTYGDSRGKRRVGEKTPGHRFYLDRIFTWFPGTRILVIRRDPRDVVASHLLSPWVTGQMSPNRLRAPLVRRLRLFHVAERAHLWRQANGKLLAGATEDPRMHVVVYENLVTEPERELRQICAFLGEEYQPSMLNRRAPARTTSDQETAGDGAAWTDWEKTHNVNADAPVSAGSIGQWRERLSAKEAALVESICGPTMKRYGYNRVMPRTSGSFLGHALFGAGRIEGLLRGERPPFTSPKAK